MANSDRKPFETATVLDQDFLDDCQDNLLNKLQMAMQLEAPTGTLYFSDRNMYVGSTFYEARLTFPEIKRTVGEFLSPEIEFSNISLELNNVDELFNNVLPAGADYDGWVGRKITIQLGLRDVASTYKTIFEGFITHEGGFQRSTGTVIFFARNKFDSINQNFPTAVFTSSVYPDIEEDQIGKVSPIIYGDWTTVVEPDSASVPGIVVNGADVDVNGDTSHTNNVECVISNHDLVTFDSTQVYFEKGEDIAKVDAADIVNIGAGNRTFEVVQNGTTVINDDGDPLEYSKGDKFFVKVDGKDLGASSDNIVEIAKDILKTYGGLVDADFDSTWATFAAKASPSESAISTFLARAWVQEPQSVVEYTLSLLEQVRLEYFINADLKLSISSLHFDDFVAAPSFTVKNWDVEQKSMRLSIDDRTNFNRLAGDYNFLPNRDQAFARTPVFRNQAAVTQAGKEISKALSFPNLYIAGTVTDQVEEILKLASAYLEIIDLNLTWRSMLLDIGGFVKMDVKIEGTQFDEVPSLIRDIIYTPDFKIRLKLFSFQMTPFPGHSPGFNGITGGSTAIITEE
jgi:hypothetical protein